MLEFKQLKKLAKAAGENPEGLHIALLGDTATQFLATAIKGEAISLMGDGNLAGVEHCYFKDVKAKVTHVADSKGHYRYLYSRKRVIGAKCWLWLFPIRRYLLGIYRRL